MTKLDSLFPALRSASLRAARFVPSTRRCLLTAALGAAVCPFASDARAGLISAVTEGPTGAPYFYNLTVEFSNGNYYDFSLRSTSSSITGEALLDTVAADTPGMSVQQTSFSFGDAVNGITIGTDTNSGFVNNSFWNYWNGSATPTVQWTYAANGESATVLSSGQADGWVFNSGSAAPQATSFPIAAPEPGTWTLLGLSAAGLGGGSFLRRRRAGGASSLPV